MLDFKAIGLRIKLERKHQKYTQEQLAEILDISVEHLSRIENGAFSPSLSLIQKISNALNVPEENLLFGIEANNKSEDDLIKRFRNLSDDKKSALFDIIDIVSKI